jgi:hypothetical protein
MDILSSETVVGVVGVVGTVVGTLKAVGPRGAVGVGAKV